MHVSRKETGTTMIELLSVMTIILLFASLIMGSIGITYEKTRQAQCVNNQHQLANALILYALDNDNFPNDLALFKNNFNENKKIEIAILGVNFATAGVIEQYIDNQLDVFRCPKVKGTIYDNPPVYSYGYNGLIKGLSYHAITEPSELVLIADSDCAEINTHTEVAYRHMFGAIAGFADGHVEWMKDFYPVTIVTEIEEGGIGQIFDGDVSINPTGNPDLEFEMQIVGGTLITREDLLGNRDLEYEGLAIYVRMTPKGEGGDNYLNIDM